MRHLKNILIVIMLISLVGCAARNSKPKPPLRLYQNLKKEKNDYSRQNEYMVYENNNLKISVTSLKKCCGVAKNEFLSALFHSGYIVLSMKLENKSNGTLIYNPSLTSILAPPLDLKKPLNYTDLYFSARSNDSSSLPEKKLASLKGKFFDRNTRLAPGRTVEKLLIFMPLKNNTRGHSAKLSVQEIYTGTNPISVSFLFKVAREKPAQGK